ncbi:MAG TPA: hexose kinase [Arachnia sp.]|nr:hexose kinase [Arachnia sp.]HMT85771.1 hexose kinase [Arachnia sp.]
MSIHCITPNPALDVTYRVPRLELHAVNRIAEVSERPGGKGVNVARLLAARGDRVAAYGFLGGATGTTLAALLGALSPGVEQRWTEVPGETRRTVAVVDETDTTMLNERGAVVAEADWGRLIDQVAQRCNGGDVVTVSGSLPAGSTPAQLSALVRSARARGAVVLVDTSGPALLAAAEAGADVVKPNHHELQAATGCAGVREGAEALLALGVGAVVVSRGEDGLLLVAPGRAVAARLGRVLQGNPTGAGDALVSALAHGLATPGGLAERLIDALPQAVAWSAAAVASPVAGEIDSALATGLLTDITIEEL